MALRNLFGNLTDVIGTKLGLPEFNYSEGIAKAPTVNTSDRLRGLMGIQTAQAAQPATIGVPSMFAPMGVQQGPQGTTGGLLINPKLGSTSGGVTGAPSGAFSAGGRIAGAVDDTPYRDEQARLNTETAKREELARSQASSIFDPLAQNFDTQISRIPRELEELRGGVERGARAGQDIVRSQLQALLGTLGQQEQGVREATGKSLRGLAEDQRGMTTSIARQLGARGAGDTSAGDYAGASIGRQGLKQRGAALESQAQGIREIEGRRVQTQQTANQELNRIEQAKQQELNSIARDFQDIQRQLESAKATASSDQRRYIAEQQNALREQLSQRLSDLEGEARQRKAALSDWATRQEQELAFNLQRLSQGARYDSTDVLKNLSKAANLVGGLGEQITPAGVDYITQQYGVPSGLFTSAAPKKDPIDELIEQSLAGGTAVQPQSNGLIPDNIPLVGRF